MPTRTAARPKDANGENPRYCYNTGGGAIRPIATDPGTELSAFFVSLRAFERVTIDAALLAAYARASSRHTLLARGRKQRDVFITRLDPASQAVNNRFLRDVKSTEGHVVVRVFPDGTYRIFVTDSRDENDRISFAGERRISRND